MFSDNHLTIWVRKLIKYFTGITRSTCMIVYNSAHLLTCIAWNHVPSLCCQCRLTSHSRCTRIHALRRSNAGTSKHMHAWCTDTLFVRCIQGICSSMTIRLKTRNENCHFFWHLVKCSTSCTRTHMRYVLWFGAIPIVSVTSSFERILTRRAFPPTGRRTLINAAGFSLPLLSVSDDSLQRCRVLQTSSMNSLPDWQSKAHHVNMSYACWKRQTSHWCRLTFFYSP